MASADGAAPEASAEGAAADGAALALGACVAPPVQADATIATIASGAATRRNAYFVVNSISCGRDGTFPRTVAPATADTARSALLLLVIAVFRDGGWSGTARAVTNPRAFHCRANRASRV